MFSFGLSFSYSKWKNLYTFLTSKSQSDLTAYKSIPNPFRIDGGKR
jgi:hypothetical protein